MPSIHSSKKHSNMLIQCQETFRMFKRTQFIIYFIRDFVKFEMPLLSILLNVMNPCLMKALIPF